MKRRITPKTFAIIMLVVILGSTLAAFFTLGGPMLPIGARGGVADLRALSGVGEVLAKLSSLDVKYYGEYNGSLIITHASYRVLDENDTSMTAMFISSRDNETTEVKAVFSKPNYMPLSVTFGNSTVDNPQFAMLYLSQIINLHFTPIGMASLYHGVLNGTYTRGVKLELVSEGNAEIGGREYKTWTYRVFEENATNVEEYIVSIGDVDGYAVVLEAHVKFTDGSTFNFNVTDVEFKG